jgi:dephospho-CoA kinase
MSKLIGISGGIGSGKSVVCKIFSSLGVPVYNADERAKWLIQNDESLKEKLTLLLGAEAYLSNGSYNRGWVAAQVFEKPDLLQQLSAVVHPQVAIDTDNWAKAQSHEPYLVKEAALFSKSGQGTQLDKLVVVVAPTLLRISRIQTRDPHRSEADILKIIANQLTDQARLQTADYVIENNETQLLIPQVYRLHQLFLSNKAV